MSDLKSDSCDWQSDGARNTVRLGLWTAAWLLTLAVATSGPKLIWDFATLPSVLAVLVNLGVGIGMILANKQHLQGLDELQQKIFLDAAALSLGVGLVCGFSYELLEDIKLVSFEPEIWHLIVVMSLAFLAGTIAGHRKYR
ncbi:MAG: hypothetical protein AB8G18_05925 [Gammaproteobacteria bacterium]